MLSLPVVRRALRELRWPIVGYGGGLAAVAILYVLLFPTFADQFAGFELPEGYAAFIGDVDFTTPRGYIQTEYYSFWLPLLLVIFAVVSGTSLLAGDEGQGTLELVLAQPVSRRSVLLSRAAALVVALVGICALAGIGFAVSAPLIDLQGDVTVLELAVAPLALVPFGVAWVAATLFVSTVAPSRGQSAALLTALLVAMYIMDVLPDLVGRLDALHYLSFFFYGDTKRVLTAGPVPWHLAVLLGVAVLMIALALRAFEARELRAGRWQLRALAGRPA